VQLDWTTFALEIVNFLVLVWILRRFLYRPVLAAIARRRANIEQSLHDADTRLTEAKELERQYRERLADWQREKEQSHLALQGEIERERARLMDTLKAEQEQQREKARVLDARRAEELRRSVESEALVLSGRFVARLLTRLASADLEARIIETACEDLDHLPQAQRATLQAALRAGANNASVTSAYPLREAQRTALTAALQRVGDGPLTSTLHEDPTLLAGVRIEIGPWVLRANLHDELAFFAEPEHASDAGSAP
jgi:F-type H+-transporting ATPase subunit b